MRLRVRWKNVTEFCAHAQNINFLSCLKLIGRERQLLQSQGPSLTTHRTRFARKLLQEHTEAFFSTLGSVRPRVFEPFRQSERLNTVIVCSRLAAKSARDLFHGARIFSKGEDMSSRTIGCGDSARAGPPLRVDFPLVD